MASDASTAQSTPPAAAPVAVATPPSSQPLTGLPARYFTDAGVFARARERIFYRTWQFACHASQVSGAGDYFAFDVCGESLFVMRGRDGQLRAFYNVCRHRGHPLLDAGAGKRATIVCPYHAWSYALDGKLRKAPGADGVAGFNPQNIRLRAVRLEEFLGFVFVNLDHDAPTLDECYPQVREAALALCPDIASRKLAHEFCAREDCNWLIAVENYNECYHCRTAHRSFAEGIIDPASYNIAPFGVEQGGRCLRHVQRGVGSRGFSPGPLMVDPNGGINNELSIATLHQWLRAAVDD